MKKHNGFTIVEALLILVIVSLIGGTGWFVWHSKQSTDKSAKDSTSASSSTVSVTKAIDPTADWVAYSNKEGNYSLKYPRTWAIATNPGCGVDDLLLMGGDSKSVGKYCADGASAAGQIQAYSMAGNNPTQLDSKYYKDIVTKKITVAGVDGTRLSSTTGDPDQVAVTGAYPQGSTVINYYFYTNGRTYYLTYVKTSSYPDVLSDFDLMVTKTLKFSAS